MTSTPDKLLRCPFCGNEVEGKEELKEDGMMYKEIRHKTLAIKCVPPLASYNNNNEDIFETWNTRYDTEKEKLKELVLALCITETGKMNTEKAREKYAILGKLARLIDYAYKDSENLGADGNGSCMTPQIGGGGGSTKT